MTRAGALIGRDSELAMLDRLVAETAAGRGSTVLIEGEPGIGKSALVRTSLANAGPVGCEISGAPMTSWGRRYHCCHCLRDCVREPSANPRRNAIVRLLLDEDAAGQGADVATLASKRGCPGASVRKPRI